MSASSKEVTRTAWRFTREYSHARAYLHALWVPRHGTFSKLVERREAAKLYLAHKLARFFCYRVSNTYLRVPAQARALETRVPCTYGCRKLTREQALHYMCVTHTRLSSYLWAVLYDLPIIFRIWCSMKLRPLTFSITNSISLFSWQLVQVEWARNGFPH